MTNDPSLPPEPLPLTEASAQEIQLELIRRHRYNEFDGRRVVASLRQHRKLWQAALIDHGLGYACLVKLRDLPGNFWNVDTLFVLTEDLESAEGLAVVAEEDRWSASNVQVYRNLEDRVRVLGTSKPGHFVKFWWD